MSKYNKRLKKKSDTIFEHVILLIYVIDLPNCYFIFKTVDYVYLLKLIESCNNLLVKLIVRWISPN